MRRFTLYLTFGKVRKPAFTTTRSARDMPLHIAFFIGYMTTCL